jgi:nuclear GTP-binding protein
MRTKSTIDRLNMYKGGAAKRDKNGVIIGGVLMMKGEAGGKAIGDTTRIAPDRRWFGNTRTMGQKELDSFRDEMKVKDADPYSIVLRRKKIPMALLKESEEISTMNLLETESFESVFGDKKTRKRPKFDANANDGGLAALMANANSRAADYGEGEKDRDSMTNDDSSARDAVKDDLFSKGQSKRIWGELYKVLDSSDVVLQVVDARNVPGTRSKHIENHIKKNASHKHLVIVLNKCDLVPSWVTRKWVKHLSKDFPTLAFHASITNSFGKGALISLLRQFGKLHMDKRQISVGVIGYPNTGKSSVINALMGTKCCKAAPVPGETKVWQYITLMKRIFLIDCPGVVYDTGDSEVDTVLKGVVRAERIQDPTDFIQPILDRTKKEYITKQYLIKEWTDHMDFLTQLAYRNGKLMKGGEPDLKSVAVVMINDWQRGRIPFFVPPPREEAEGDEAELVDDDEEDEEEDEDVEGEEDADLEKVAANGPQDRSLEDDSDDDEEEDKKGV